MIVNDRVVSIKLFVTCRSIDEAIIFEFSDVYFFALSKGHSLAR